MAPKTIQEAVKVGQPISVVAKVSGLDAIRNQIEFDLIKCMSLLNLNLGIKEHQYQFIVRELVDTFPNESIQDFQLCFRNGIKGYYGKIYNVDLSVLAIWMGQYLEEKYTYIEKEQKREQAEFNELQANVVSELIERTTKAIEQSETKEQSVVRNTEALRDRIIGRLSDAEIKAEGQEKPKRTPYKPNEEAAREILLKQEWMKECFDPITGKPNDNYKPIEEWKKNLKI